MKLKRNYFTPFSWQRDTEQQTNGQRIEKLCGFCGMNKLEKTTDAQQLIRKNNTKNGKKKRMKFSRLRAQHKCSNGKKVRNDQTIVATKKNKGWREKSHYN